MESNIDIDSKVRIWRRALLLLLALLFVSASPALAAAATASAVPAAPAGDASEPPRTPANLYQVATELVRMDTLHHAVAVTLRETAHWQDMAKVLDQPVIGSSLQALEASRDQLSRTQYVELVDADMRVREQAREVTLSTDLLGRWTQRVEADLQRLDAALVQAPKLAELARAQEAPADFRNRIDEAAAGLEALRGRVRLRRDELLIIYERGIRLQGRLAGLRSEIAERRERIDEELHTQAAVPIWARKAPESAAREMELDLRLTRHDLEDYFKVYGRRVATLFGIPALLVFLVLLRSSRADWRRFSMAPPTPGMAAVIALLSSCVFLLFTAPPGPYVFYRLLGTATPILAGIVATRTFAAVIPATAWALVFALEVRDLRVIAEVHPILGETLLLAQIIPLAIALHRDWRQLRLVKFLKWASPTQLRRLVQGVHAAMALTVAASVLGYITLMRSLGALIIVAPALALVSAAIAQGLTQVVAGVLAAPVMQFLRSVRERGELILRALRRIVVLFCFALGTGVFLLKYLALDDVLAAGDAIANASLSAGEVTITVGAILQALLIAIATWAVTKVTRFVLDHELLPRLNLRAGVPVAISTVIGYALIVAGFLLAMGALGIDLTKVTLLAGALGVGVGLGLQNVVNNFASGLILMIERPVNVGDQIDVGGVLGEVKRIGVRSSTLRTPEGAEVILPNSDLAATKVTNWTLSDRSRRFEVTVGVAYGSDPAQVMRLLVDAVAALPDVLKAPPPRALFAGFGDSSLDFRVFAWVPSVDVALQAQNAMRVAILSALKDAGIDMPFPQRDINIRYAPAGTLPAQPQT